MIVSGIKAANGVEDENSVATMTSQTDNSDVMATVVASTPLRKIGGGGYVSPAAFAAQMKLHSTVGRV